MPRFTYTGPTYNPSVGISIEGANMDSWDGITANDISGDAVFLRAMLLFYIFPGTMSDADVLSFITQYPQYTSWWADSGTGNNNSGGFQTQGHFPSREDAQSSVANGLFFTISNTNSIFHGVVMEMISDSSEANYPSQGRFESVEAAILAGLGDGDFFTLNNPESELHMALIEIIQV